MRFPCPRFILPSSGVLPLAGLALLLLPAMAAAHPVAGEAHAFRTGLAHPLTGADHMLAMVAVGLWAAAIGGRALWAMPATFLAAMLAGSSAGAASAVTEQMILASTTLVCVAAALALRPALPLVLAVLAVAGGAHGMAHGAEGSGEGLYAAGFLAATLALHLAGLALGRGLAGIGGAGFQRAGGSGRQSARHWMRRNA